MNRKFWIIGLLCLVLVVIQTGPQAAYAAADRDQMAYSSALTGSNLSMSGAMTSKQFNYWIEKYWNVSEVKVNLDYQVTQLAKNDSSSITLTMNGTKFYSFRPTVSEGKQRLTVNVPKELLVQGNNSLSIDGDVRTAVDYQICTPTDSKDDWLQIYDTSDVGISYRNEALSGGIADFNDRFTGMDTIRSDLGVIAVPVKSEASELEAAVYALSGFAKANQLKERVIPIDSFQSGVLVNKKLVVAIALYDSLPAEYKQSIDGNVLQDKAVIQTLTADGRPTLVVTSKNPDLLVKAGRMLANQELVAQLTGSTKWVDSGTNVDAPAVDITKNMKLTETGDKIKGEMHQEKQYFVSLPANRTIADASKISLDFRYAKNLDFNRSMVTVLLNDKPIGSKKLTSELADGDTLELPIPPNAGITGNFSLTVAFDLQLQAAGCVEPPREMPWAYIDPDSVLRLNTKDKSDLLFNSYPNPYLRDGRFNQIAVVLPGEKDEYTYQTIANLFNLLGQYAEGNTGVVRFYDENVADSELQDSNVIAIGTYLDNKVIRDHNDKFYFKYGPGGEGFQSNEKMSIDADYGKRLGVVQLIESPYKAGLAFLTVTGASSESYSLASKLLDSDNSRWKIYGDGVATDKDGTIKSYRFKKEIEQEKPDTVKDLLQRTDVMSFVAVAALVLIFVLVSLILLLSKYRKKRRGSNETR
ncbi:cellulose biosynthesis cyclic di-GMP-binding regulatory protein BcsB [Gorillibacterium massiliense]|uniref:cellulose biosynthesis cyclic di-GMP-binding regulatory protein BcsB n=1 Tax=Gorillibacterium massiliense TaxID=1280390 RepID=UPI0004BA04C7|nr:cellulose biosynthesis cyclic di-GMP-binding regulatory protein BcsB [Gorillibacterium massiliense]